MKFGPFEITYSKVTKKPENLYLALIGKIDSRIISENHYINYGEYSFNYTIVKQDNTINYFDIFNNNEYEFRNEESNATILKMRRLSEEEKSYSTKQLKILIDNYNETLKDNKVKKGDKKVYIRTRK